MNVSVVALRKGACACALSVGFGYMLWAPGANADTIVEIGLGSNPSGDIIGSGPGSVTGTGSTDGISVTATGMGNPPLTEYSILDTTLRAVASAGAAGTAQVWVTETGLPGSDEDLSGSPRKFISDFGNTSSGVTITEKTFLDTSNTPFGTGTALSSEVLGPGGNLTDEVLNVDTSALFSVTAEYDITLAAGQQADGSINISTEPIPAALPLFASALGLFGFGAWTKRRKQARLEGVGAA